MIAHNLKYCCFLFSFSQDVLLGDDSFIRDGAWYVALGGWGGRILGFCLIPILLYTLRVSLGGSLTLGTGHTSRFRKLVFFFFFGL